MAWSVGGDVASRPHLSGCAPATTSLSAFLMVPACLDHGCLRSHGRSLVEEEVAVVRLAEGAH